MNPVSLQEVDEEQKGTARPGNGICPGNGGQLVYVTNCDRNIDDTDHTPAAEHNDHGNGCFACTPQDACDTMGEGKQAEEKANGSHMHNTKFNYFLGFVKEPDQLRAKLIKYDSNQFGHNCGAKDAKNNASFDSVVLLCS